MVPGETAVSVAPLTSPVIRARARGVSRQFYVWMAYACAFIAFAGFTPSYWAPVATGSFAGPSILHVHGLLFSAWTLLFVAQARFAASGRFEHHRAVGLAGISVATAMLIFGILVATASIEAGIARGLEQQARAFSIVPITIILSFAGLVAAAIANIRRPEIHMRLMLAASISVLPPAIARVVLLLLSPERTLKPAMGDTPPIEMSLIPSFAANLLLVVAIVYDWRRRGRPHPAYLIAGAFLVVVQVARIPLSRTAAWHAVTDWLVRMM